MKTEGEIAKDIAAILNKTLGTTYSFLHPAVQAVTQYVEDYAALERKLGFDEGSLGEDL
jgi:DNA-directed RNA polymerase specialized sigma24 family protein